MEKKKISFLSRAVMMLFVMLLTASTAWADDITISSTEEWNTFASSVNSGTTYSGQTVTLAADITITTMAGTSDHKFSGTFNGSGHTLTLNLTTDGSEFTAPFRYAKGATIKLLNTAGTIYGGNQKYAAGLIGSSEGTVNITACRSSVAITSDRSSEDNKDATHGGFIGVASGTVTFTNCLFDGSITDAAATNCGGFVGWRNGSLTFNSCLMAGTMTLSSTSGSATFNRSNSSNTTLNNCYYKTAYGDVQGTQTSVTGSALQPLLGSGWQVSGNSVVPIMDGNNLGTATISGINSYYLYTGSAIAIDYTVTAADGTALTKGTHYTETISPATVRNKGDYTLTITGISPYSGFGTFNFTVGDAIPVTSETTTMTTGAYKVAQDVIVSSRITISGEVELILGEGTTLTASKGIEVSKGNKLTINGTGTLTANGDTYEGSYKPNASAKSVGRAGIGATEVGTIIINGGTINATGGAGIQELTGAGIGGNCYNTDGGTIIINGGIVNAVGQIYSAGIGAGGVWSKDNSQYGIVGTIIINGGQVTAWGVPKDNSNCVGIGAGVYGDSSKGSLTLDWTTQTDFVKSSNYHINSITFKKAFDIENTSTLATKDNSGGNKIVPSNTALISLASAVISDIPNQTWTGYEIKPSFTVTLNETQLVKDTDYEVSYTDNVNVGTDATVTITGKGQYVGSVSKTFTIVAYSFDGSGTAESPYLIQTADDLLALSGYVKHGTSGYVSAHYRQTADLDMSGIEMHPIGATIIGVVPPTTGVFSGVYDGGGFTISHLTINESGRYFVGLFGNAEGATIKRVTLDNTCSISGYYTVGGLVGYADNNTTALIGNVVSGSVNATIKDTSGALIGRCYHYGNLFYNNYYTAAASPQRGVGAGSNWIGGDLTSNSGVVRGYAITLPDDVSTTTIGETGVMHPRYAADNEVLTLTATAPASGMKRLAATAGTLAATSTAGTVTLTMPASDVTVSLDNVTINIEDIAAQTYTGSPITPALTVKDGETTLTLDTDYTLAYSNNINAGDATVTITGKGLYVGTATKTFTISYYAVTLANDTNNTDAIDDIIDNYGGKADVTLTDRTLKKNGEWNTICLPFSLSASQIAGSPLANATLMEMQNTTSLENGVLTLNFATATAIEAGKPYLIKWASGSDIVAPVFNGVTITSTTPTEVTSTDGKVTFVGQYSPFTIDSNNKDNVLMLGSGNKIGYSKNDRTLKCFRAHFQINDVNAVREFNMNFGDETTNIQQVESGKLKVEGYYDLQGRKVAQPTKGLYIVNGKKVVVK